MPQNSKKDYVKPAKVTQRGIEEVLMGDPNRPAATYTPYGTIQPTYIGDAQESPTILTESPLSGGITTQDAVQRAVADNAAQEVQRFQEISQVMEKTSQPVYYNRASYLKQAGKQIGAAFGGASEFFGKIAGDISEGAYANAVKANFADMQWSSAVRAAGGPESQTVSGLRDSVYMMNQMVTDPETGKRTLQQVAVPLVDLTDAQISTLKVDDLKTADGKELSKEQKDLFYQYRQFNEAQVADRISIMAGQVFGQDFNDWWSAGLNTESPWFFGTGGQTYKGDIESQKWGALAGQVAASIAVFQVVGGAGTTAIANAAVKGTGTAAKVLKASKFAKNMQTTYGPMLNSMSATMGQAGVYGTSFWNQYYDLRGQAIMNGMSLSEANKMAFLGGLLEAGWESWGFQKMKGFLKTKPSFSNLIFKDIIPEGSQEFMQTLSENAVTSFYGMNSKTLEDIAMELAVSFAAGGIGGGVIGAAHYSATKFEYAAEGIRVRETKSRKDLATKYEQWVKQQNPFVNNPQPQTVVAEDGKTELVRDEQGRTFIKNEDGELQPVLTNTELQQIGMDNAPEAEVVENTIDSRIQNPDIAQEMARLDETVMTQYKDLYYEMARSVTKGQITQKQLDNGWHAVERLIHHEASTGEITSTLQEATDRYLAGLKYLDEQSQKNIEELKTKLQDINGVAINEEALLSSNADERYEAQWAYAQSMIEKDFAQNGASEAGKTVSQMFRNIFEETMLLSGNMTPMDMYNAFKPTITSFRRAQLNDQKIQGVDSFLDGVVNRTASTSPVEAKEAASTLAQHFVRYQETQDEKEANAIKAELFQSVDKDLDINTIMGTYASLATEEYALAREMGTAWGNDLTQTDYLLMAIMRSQGYNQKQINEAWGIEQPNAIKSYLDAIDTLFPALSEEEVANLEGLMQTQGESEQIRGAYATARAEQEGEQPQSGIFLVQNANQNVALEEAAHWLYDIMDRVANVSAIPTAMGENAELPIMRLKNEIDKNIRLRRGNKTKITPTMVQETFAEFVVKYAQDSSDKNVNPQLRDAYEAVMEEYNKTVQEINPDSISKDMTAQAKKGLNKAVAQLFKPADAAARISIAKEIEAKIGSAKNTSELAQFVLEAIDQHNIPDEVNFATQLASGLIEGPDQLDYVDVAALAANVALIQRKMALDQLLGTYFQEKNGKYQYNYNIENKIADDFRYNFTDKDGIFYSKADVAKSKERTPARQGKSLEEKARETIKQLSPASALDGAREFGETLVHAAKKASPALANIIQRNAYELSKRILWAERLHYEFNNLISTHNKNAHEKGIGQVISQSDWEKFSLLLFNNSRKKARAMFANFFQEGDEQTKAFQLFDSATTALDSVYDQLTSLGVKIEKINGYWPPIVDKVDELNLKLWEMTGMKGPRPEPGSEISKMAKRMSRQGKTIQDIIDAVGGLMQRNPTDKEVSAFHQRILQYKSLDLIPYYKDPIDSLMIYLKSASRTIFMRQLFGDLQIGDNGEIQWGKTGLVPSFLIMAKTKQGQERFGKIDATTEQNLLRRIRQFMKRDAADQDIWEGMRALQGITALGNVANAINQALELAPAMQQFGFQNVVKAMSAIMAKSNLIDVEIANVQLLNESIRLDREGLLKDIQEDVLKATGFSKMDVFMKNIVLNAALIHAQGVLANWSVSDPSIAQRRFQRYFEESFPSATHSEEQLTQIKNDILAGNMTDDVKFFCRNALARTQPIDSTEIAANYNAMGTFGRACYYLTTVSLKQIQWLIDDFKANLKEMSKGQAVKEFAKFLWFALIIGVPVEVLTSLLLGKKPDMKSAIVFSPAQYFLINEYYWNTAKDRGLWTAMGERMMPGFRIADDLWKDIMYSGQLGWRGRTHFLNSVPIVGRQMYNYLGGGKEQLKKRKENIGSTFEDDLNFFGDNTFS